jgi:signal transduction histidine kinase
VVGGAWIVSICFAIGIALSSVAVPWPQFAAACALAAVSLGLATLVAVRSPRHPMAGWISLPGVAAVLTNTVDGTRLGPFEGDWMLLYLPFAILLLLVPTGHPTGPRWRLAGWAITLDVALFMTVVAVQWRWPELGRLTVVPTVVLLLGFFILLIVCAASPVVRYRRADERLRNRLRWVFLAGMSLPLTLLLCWTSYLLIGTADLVVFGLFVMYIAIPLGTTIAILRPELFDIDRAAVATVAATMLSVVVLIILSVASGVAGLRMVEWSPVAALSSTAALAIGAALVYQPLRRALDRMLYPDRGRALAGLMELARRVDVGLARPEEVEGVLRETLHDSGLVIGYRGVTDGRLQTADGHPVTVNPGSVSVRVRGEEIGVIVPAGEGSRRPASEIARAAAPMMDAVRLGAELARATAEVEASRERMLRAGYEERRRLERDLHDGAQQRLVALGMRLRVLQRTSPGDDVSDSLDMAVAELGTAVTELRQIAHGMRPSALDDGLAFALSDLARLAPGVIELDVRAVELPDAVATTAYYVVSEAVANALRHAGASQVRVCVHQEPRSQVHIRVDDDGCGGADPQMAGGLTGLADRVGALGGSFSVASPRGAGTVVEAVLPCAS